MKTRIVTLLMALFAFAWSAKADEITSMKLTISFNYGEFFEETFPPQGWTDLDITDEPATSIRIKKVEVQTSGTVSDVVFEATMYKTEIGLRPDDGWRTFNLSQQGNAWVIDFGENAPDLIDSEMGFSPRTFQFHVTAKDGSGNDIFYNNGGLDYKVLFVKGNASQQIKSLKLTVRHNKGEAFTQEFPAENFPEFDLTDKQTTSLIIEKVEVEADASVSDVNFYGTIFSANSSPSPNEWQSFPLQSQGGGNWVLDMGAGVELIESKWLTENKTKTFEFFVQAKDGSGNDIYYNNGGEDYKVTFTTGESGGQKIQFVGDNAGTIVLRADNNELSYTFDKNGNRNPNYQPGQVNSLSIEQFSVMFSHADGVDFNDVSLQYKVYEEGHADEVGWNRIDAMSYNYLDGNTVYFYNQKANCEVTNGLEPGKEYVLEMIFQVVADGKYFFLGKDKEDSRFRFSRTGGGGQTEGIRSFKLTVSCDGEVFTEEFPATGWPAQIIPGQTASIKILKAEVEASEAVTYVGFCYTMYDTEDGWQHDDSAWHWVGCKNIGDGHWVLDFGEGQELIESEWLTESKTKTFEFFADGGDDNKNKFQYANGISDYGYNNNYKVTFTTGPNDDAISPIPASKNKDGALYNLAGQHVNDNYRGIVISAGKKILKK